MAAPRLTVSIDERTRCAQTRLGDVVLGKWRLSRLVGIGGMAAVFEALHVNGSRAAIKVLHADLAGSEEMRERFLAEAYAANRVAHPGVVAVRDEGTMADGAVFLVMDLLEGQTLAERLAQRGGPFTVPEVLEIVSQLLDVLVQAHGRGVVHRDIKPENVLLTTDGRVRLLDFGIARVDSASRTPGVMMGTTLGTPAFMSPEQALGQWEDVDQRSDLWSLGATMYLMLSGRPVREPGSEVDQLLRAMTRPVTSLGNVAAVPRSVVAVVDRALAFDRDERFPDARSMQLALRAVVEELHPPGGRGSQPPGELVGAAQRGPSSEPPRKRHSVTTVPPVTSSPAPKELGKAPRPGALAVFVSLGFAVGIGIVVAARLSVSARIPVAGHVELDGATKAVAGAIAPTIAPSAASSVPQSPSASPSSWATRRER